MNDMFVEYPDLIDVDMLCSMLDVGKNTVYKLLRENEIKSFQIGRAYKIPKRNVIKFILDK